MSIWRFKNRLPEVDPQWEISLGEGNTPLLLSRRLGPAMGLSRLYFKMETSNPSGSYKDRFAASAVSHLLSSGAKLCLGTSSGNTGSALAAYCAAAGMPCVLAIVDTAPEGKLQQMLAYGAHLYKIRDFGLDPEVTGEVMTGLGELAQSYHGEVQISAYTFSPLGMAGVQSISYELAEQLPKGIDHVFSPSGGGGLTLAVARGFARTELEPAIHCVQPEGNNTIAGPLRNGSDQAHPVRSTSTISGLQVGSIIDGDQTLVSCRASGGNGHLVSDDVVYDWQRSLAREEGIFCEPAGAVALAGLALARENGEIEPDAACVCLVTGNGFKDEKSLRKMGNPEGCPRLDDFSAFGEALAKMEPGS